MATRTRKTVETEREAAQAAAARTPVKKATPAKKATRAKKAEPTVALEGKLSKEDAKAKISKEYKLPKTPAAAADMLYAIRERRLNVQKEVDALASFETQLKDFLIDSLPKSDASGAAGKIARVQIVTEDQPVVSDWDAFYTHIKKKGEFDLLNRALNRSAAKARLGAGKKVPGLGTFTATKVSITKL